MRARKVRSFPTRRSSDLRRWNAYGNLPSHTRGGSRMRESRTYGSVRGACDETHVPTATCARQSWCDPAGESPAQVKGSVLLGSECCVATGDSGCEAYTAIAWGVGLSLVRSDIAGAEGFNSLEGNMCEIGRASCRERVEISVMAVAVKKKRDYGYVLSSD